MSTRVNPFEQALLNKPASNSDNPFITGKKRTTKTMEKTAENNTSAVTPLREIEKPGKDSAINSPLPKQTKPAKVETVKAPAANPTSGASRFTIPLPTAAENLAKLAENKKKHDAYTAAGAKYENLANDFQHEFKQSQSTFGGDTDYELVYNQVKKQREAERAAGLMTDKERALGRRFTDEEFEHDLNESLQMILDTAEWEARNELNDAKEARDAARYAKYKAYEYAPDFYKYSQYNPDVVDKGDKKALRLYNMINGGDDYGGDFGQNDYYLLEASTDQKHVYNYIYATEGKTAADEYLDFINNDLTAKARERIESEAAANVDKNFFSRVKENVDTVITKPFADAVAFAGQTADTFKSSFVNGEDVNPNATYNTGMFYNNAVRNETGNRKGPVGKFLYQNAMSTADFLYQYALSYGIGSAASGLGLAADAGKAAEAISLAMMGTDAAAETTSEGLDRGLTGAQAYAMGLVAGTAEILTEKVSLETLLDPDFDKDGAAKFILKNMAAEGSEEVASDFINLTADIVMLGEKSEWQEKINELAAEYERQGMSKEDAERKAKNKAFLNKAEDVGLSFLGGALSGGFMAGMRVGGSAVTTKIESDRAVKAYHDFISTADTRGALELCKVQGDNMIADVTKRIEETPGQTQKQQLTNLRDRLQAERDSLNGDTNEVLTKLKNARAEQNATSSDKALNYETVELVRKGLDENFGKDGRVVLPTAEQTAAAEEATRPQGRQNQTARVDTSSVSVKDLNSLALTVEQQEVAKKATATQIDSAKAFEDSFGWETRLYSKPAVNGKIEDAHIEKENGRYIFYLNIQSPKTVSAALGHEITHTIENTSVYKDLVSLVSSRLAAEGKNVSDLIAEATDRWSGKYETELSPERAMQEIVADYIGNNLLNNAEALTDVAKESPDLWSKLKYHWNSAIAKLTNSGYKSVKAEAEQIRRNIEKADTAAEDYYVKRQQKQQRAEQQAQNEANAAKTDENAQETKKPKKAVPAAENTAEKEKSSAQMREELTAAYQNGGMSEAEFDDALDAIYEQELKEGIHPGDEFRASMSRVDKEYDKPITVEDVRLLRDIVNAHNGERVSINDFTSEDIQKAQKWAYKFYQELGTKSPFFRAWFGDWRAQDNTATEIVNVPTIDISEAVLEYGDYFIPDTDWTIHAGSTLNNDTRHHSGGNRINVKALKSIETILNNAILFDSIVSYPNNNTKSSNTEFLHKFYSIINYNSKHYLAVVSVEEFYNESKNNDDLRAYNLKAIKIEPFGGSEGLNPTTSNVGEGSTISISDLYSLVKQYDKDFHPGKPVNPYFLKEDGTPKEFYHGTKKNGGFTEFRDWQYFTENRNYAERYAERDNEKSLYSVYLTADKIFDTRDPAARKIFEDIRNEYGLGELQDTGLPDWTDGYDITDYLNEHPELGYDAVVLDEGGDMVNGEPVSRGESIIIKDSTQIKSATDNIGTFDRGNRDIRYSVSEVDSEYMSLAENYDSLNDEDKAKVQAMVDEAAKRAFPDSKIVDDDGNLLVVYHGSDESFNSFDITKGRANMDIQGSFFSPWEIDAAGYGENVRKFYLNITNPADESQGYRALNSHKGENNAGVKARADLERRGFDGVNNENEEFIAFYPEQIKSADPVTYDDNGNIIPLSERFNDQERDIRWSISEIVDDAGNDYGKGVILDSNLFDGIPPRKWSETLSRFVYNNLAGKELTMYDDAGNEETVYLARVNDRVQKDGAKNSHKVIDKLARYKGDNIRALATVHLSELLLTSGNETSTDEHNHQWMDVNGWTLRKTYMQDRSGNIYEATLNIANGRDRRIIYDISNIKRIGIKKETTDGDVSSTERIGRDSLINSSFKNSISNNNDSVNTFETKMSISRTTEDKSAVMDQLRSFLDGKISRSELNSAIDAIDKRQSPRQMQNTSTVSEAQQIVDTAHAQGMNVEEYLEENAELYDNNGRWNKPARDAIDLESETRYSMSEAEEFGDIFDDTTDDRTPYEKHLDQIMDNVNAKLTDEQKRIRELEEANEYLKRQTKARDAGAPAVSLPLTARRQIAAEIARELPHVTIDQTYEALKEVWRAFETPINSREIRDTVENRYARAMNVAKQVVGRLADMSYELRDNHLSEEYWEVRDYLRNTPIMVTKDLQADTNYKEDFRKNNKGLIRFVTDESRANHLGNTDLTNKAFYIDELYPELQSMAPELFPDLEKPSDMMERVDYVARLIAPGKEAVNTIDEYRDEFVEKTASNIVNSYASRATLTAAAAHDTERLDKISEYQAKYKAEEAKVKAEANNYPKTTEEAMKLYEEMRTVRRKYDSVKIKNPLSPDDSVIVGRLLRGESTLDGIADNPNATAIRNVYLAAIPYEDMASKLAKYRRSIKDGYNAQADELLDGNLLKFKDKKAGFWYAREAAERNVRDVLKDDPQLAERIIATYFRPIHKNDAKAVKFIKDYNRRIADLNLSQKIEKGNAVSESFAVQYVGEMTDSIAQFEAKEKRGDTFARYELETLTSELAEFWKNNPNIDKAKINDAIKTFRSVYDELIGEMNRVRVENGYEPIAYRSGYFPHFIDPTPGDTVLSKLSYRLGIDLNAEILPTTYNGLTASRRPGIAWKSFVQERKGDTTTYDAIKGFDRYVAGAADMIYHTADIQRLRAFDQRIRYNASDEGIKRQIDAVYANDHYTDTEKEDKVTKIYDEARTNLSNFVVWLNDFTNGIANKKSEFDRSFEKISNRKFYRVMQWMESRNSANLILGNIRSAITNAITISQANAAFGPKWVLMGAWDTVMNYIHDDGFIDRSTLLTNRYGTDTLSRTRSDVIADILGKPQEWIDGFASQVVTRAAYLKNVAAGMSEEAALEDADEISFLLMANRSKGEMPTIFRAQNPFTKPFTQFQLEVNNELSFVFKDLPRIKRERKESLILAYFMYYIGSWIYNELFEFFTGGRAAMDPIDVLNDLSGDLTGYQMPNFLTALTDGDGLNGEDFKVAKANNWWTSIMNLGENVAEDLPFSSIIGLFDEDFDGGRLAVSSALPNFKDIFSAVASGNRDKIGYELFDELSKPAAMILPKYGGNQLQKMVKGGIALAQGGSYNVNNKGEEYLQYVAEPTAGNIIRAAIFGKSSLPTARDWVDRDFESLTPEQTDAYIIAMRAGDDDGEDVYDTILAIKNVEQRDGEKPKEAKSRVLFESGLSEDAISALYQELIASDKEYWAIDDGDISAKTLAGLNRYGKDSDKYNYLAEAGLSADEAKAAIEFVSKDNSSTAEKMLSLIEAGAEPADVLSAKADGYNFNKSSKYVEAGVSAKNAMKIEAAFSALEPEDGKKTVSDLQRYEAIVDSGLKSTELMDALSAEMTESTYNKVASGNVHGVGPDVYVKALRACKKYDTNGNGKYTQSEVTSMIDNEYGTLSDKKKAVLWQMLANTDSPKNNPYDVSAAQEYLDTLSLD